MAQYRRNAKSSMPGRTGAGIAAFVVAASFVPAALAGGHGASSTYGYGGESTPGAALAPSSTTPSPASGLAPTSAPPSRTPTSATPSPQPSSPSTLPFTGVDLAVIGAAGVVLVAAGAGVRGLSRRPGRDG